MPVTTPYLDGLLGNLPITIDPFSISFTPTSTRPQPASSPCSSWRHGSCSIGRTTSGFHWPWSACCFWSQSCFPGRCLWFGKSTKRSEEHTSELQSQFHLVCRLL